MILDSPRLENTTILTGSFEITGTVEPGDNTSYDLGTSAKRWRNVYTTGLTGSLTKTATGVDYLQAGSGIQLVTGSAGQVTISATVAGSSLVAGSNTQVQFNNGGTFGADSNFTFNSTTDTLSVTNISGSLTQLTNGQPYLVAGSGITIATGSNGSVTMSLGALSYATATFTNATSVTVNHSVGTTLYDIEVFDTSYNKILPGTATATSPTQSNLTFAIPTSGFVAVGGPTAGSQGASVYAPLLTGSSYMAADATVAAASSPVTLVTFTLPSAGTWDVTYFTGVSMANGITATVALYDSNNTKVTNTEILLASSTATTSYDSGTGRAIITTSGSATYTLRGIADTSSWTARSSSTYGRTGVVWSSLGNSTVVGGITTTTGSAPYYGARAWVNFNGTGTVAIRSSANVSSITDLGTGYYRVNFSTSMPDTDFSVLATSEHDLGTSIDALVIEGDSVSATPTSTSIELRNLSVVGSTGNARDSRFCNVAIFR